MKRIFLSALICLLCVSWNFSQEPIILSLYKVKSPSERMDSLLSVINIRETELEQIKKDKARADSLDVLVDDYVLLVGMWQDEYKNIKETFDFYNSLEYLITESDSVFNIELPNISYVPSSLKNHYDLIKNVISIQNDIQRVEREIEEKTRSCIHIKQDLMVIIPKLISEDLDAIYERIAEIKQTGLPTFSVVQKKYFDKNIRDKYNNFEKYFANE